MLLYNLFPLLAGKFRHWESHLERAAELGFDWVFVNPVHRPGASGSIYSVADYFDYNPVLVDAEANESPEEQLRSVLRRAETLGLRVMSDLVINHTAYDSPLVRQHPEWYRHANGRVAHPSANNDGKTVVWQDLADLDWAGSPAREEMYRYFRGVTEYLLGLGFKGLRCDAAYQVPPEIWRRLIQELKAEGREVTFAAETLGGPREQQLTTIRAGFDYVFSSAKWWDFKAPWLPEQEAALTSVCPTISFPESHDTVRLAQEVGGNLNALRQRYFFSAFFSAGVMIPIGFEFGFRKQLHVVKTRPEDWEETSIDLCDFIRAVNSAKRAHPIFLGEQRVQVEHHGGGGHLLVFRKGPTDSGQTALIVTNPDAGRSHRFRAEALPELLGTQEPVQCVWPGHCSDPKSRPFEHELGPGEGVVFLTEAAAALKAA